MESPTLIDFETLVAGLQARGLVIVSLEDLEMSAERKLRQLRRDYFKKRSLTIHQVLKMDLLPVKSKSGIRSWIDSGKFKKDIDYYTTSAGVIMIMVSTLKRMGYGAE